MDAARAAGAVSLSLDEFTLEPPALAEGVEEHQKVLDVTSSVLAELGWRFATSQVANDESCSETKRARVASLKERREGEGPAVKSVPVGRVNRAVGIFDCNAVDGKVYGKRTADGEVLPKSGFGDPSNLRV